MEKKKIFVIMPFEDEFFEVYEMLKMRFSDKFDFSNAGEEANQQNILKDIIQPIYEADLIIADLTGLNPNVMYELGIAHTFNKKTIIITKDELTNLPFDLKQYRAKDYSTHFKKFADLIAYLESNLYGALNDTVSFSNPVKDFLTLEKINTSNWYVEKKEIQQEDESDKGFLADILENNSILIKTINEINDEMQNLNNGVSKSTADIEKANKNGGASPTFVRKESKKVAEYIDNLSIKLRENTRNISTLWSNNEKNILGLLENKFSTTENNISSLIDFLKSLTFFKTSISQSNASMSHLKDSMKNIIGMERSLNQAIRFVLEDISYYMDTCDQIKNSIEKILQKSKFIVGEINLENI